MKVGCIIPCYRGGQRTLELLDELLNTSLVDLIIVVDDQCPLQTGRYIQDAYLKRYQDKIIVIFSSENLGVGGATKRGLELISDHDIDIAVKLDADGQMNIHLIPDLIKPIITGEADAVKGNRFTSLDNVVAMPKIRILGNLGLSFLNKLSTGYWELFDPTNGFIAFKASALKRVRLDKTDDRYFFESDLLFQCSLAQITFAQLPMSSIYGDEVSSLRPMREINRFAGKHLINFLKRLVYQYFILDFNAGSLDLLGGLLGLIVTTIFTTKIFLSGVLDKRFATAGESSLFTILSIITIQMFIAFLYYDSTQQPILRRLRK